MNIIFFTKYTSLGPSSRYRTFQFLDYYKNDFTYKVFPFFEDNYLQHKNKWYKYLKIIYYFIRRIYNILLCVQQQDIAFIEYELIPYFPPIFEKYLKYKKIKFILDFDDAIFHNYDNNPYRLIRYILKNKIPEIIKISNFIITGSPYLTEFVNNYNPNCEEIPTSIDIDKYIISPKRNTNKFIIGWIGSKATSKNINIVINALCNFVNDYNCEIKLIGFGIRNTFINNINIKIVDWSNETEIEELNTIDVGIMPLIDGVFEKGKCGFKLIQYMALCKPTISTPFEANIKIDAGNGNLFATNEDEWYNCFVEIYNNKIHYNLVGLRNRKTIETSYSIQNNYIKYKKIISKII